LRSIQAGLEWTELRSQGRGRRTGGQQGPGPAPAARLDLSSSSRPMPHHRHTDSILLRLFLVIL
jgi:hypothetical protein